MSSPNGYYAVLWILSIMMKTDEILIKYTKRSVPIPVDYRPLYKIAQILLIIVLCGRGGKISLLKLQFFIWALKSPDNRISFNSLVSVEKKTSIWSLDPTVIRAINFGIGEKLCERKDGNIIVTAAGQAFVIRLRAAQVLFLQTLFLEGVGKKVTEQKIKEIAKDWLG